jgi:DNA polymerase-3 subunit epsilon
LTFPWVGKSGDGNTIILHKLHEKMFSFPAYFNQDWCSANSDMIRVGAAIDVETTGLDQSKDKIIEIGLRIFKFNRLTGELLSLDSYYSDFQDPGELLADEVKVITGISDEMLKGKAINWEKVNALLSTCHIIIAHNAYFDRPFIDNQSAISKDKIWGCSFSQVDWKAYGFPSRKLEVLSIYHGFFTDAHRALNDSDALIYLLSMKNEKTGYPYLFELLDNSRKSIVLISATFAIYEKKDLLKSRNYKWEPQKKVWEKEIYQDQYDAEIKWLEETIYQGRFKGESKKIPTVDRFKI